MSNLSNARAQLEEWEAKKPGDYTSQYKDKIDGVMGKAQAKADEIRQGYEAQAAKARTEAENRSRKAAEDREARLVDAAEMDRRKLLLSAKQEMVGKAFDLALEKLCAMEDAQYAAVPAKMLAEAAPSGRGTVYFPDGKATVGAEAVKQANAILGEKGKLTLAPETRPIQGGFLLVDGSVEVNGTFETLVRFQKGTMASEVAKILFPEG